jgi:uncharacterized protein YciI
MAKYVLFYESAPDVMSKAPLYIEAHRALWNDFHAKGLLLMVGPFATPQDGAMGIFTTREAAENFVTNDPFVLNGVVSQWRVQEWNEALAP